MFNIKKKHLLELKMTIQKKLHKKYILHSIVYNTIITDDNLYKCNKKTITDWVTRLQI